MLLMVAAVLVSVMLALVRLGFLGVGRLGYHAILIADYDGWQAEASISLLESWGGPHMRRQCMACPIGFLELV